MEIVGITLIHRTTNSPHPFLVLCQLPAVSSLLSQLSHTVLSSLISSLLIYSFLQTSIKFLLVAHSLEFTGKDPIKLNMITSPLNKNNSNNKKKKQGNKSANLYPPPSPPHAIPFTPGLPLEQCFSFT